MLNAKQQEMRRHGIGASEIAAVNNLSPYQKPIDVYLEKRGEAKRETTEAMELGNELEPIICRRALRKLGLRDALYGETRAHPREPIALATPDFLLPERPGAALQCKSVTYRTMHHWGEELDDRGVPLYYVAQVQQEMEVWDLDVVYVAALMAGYETRIYEVRRDAEVGRALVESARRFWHDHVEAGVPPPVDGSRSSEEWLRRRYGRSTDTVLEADADVAALVETFREACVAMGKAKRLRTLYEQRIKELMGGASVLKGDGWKITWREQKGRVSWKDVATELGASEDIIGRHRAPAARVFRAPNGWSDEDEE